MNDLIENATRRMNEISITINSIDVMLNSMSGKVDNDDPGLLALKRKRQSCLNTHYIYSEFIGRLQEISTEKSG